MILQFNFEELTALRGSIESALSVWEGGGVAAPPEVVADAEALLPRLSGDVAVITYAEQQRVLRAVNLAVHHLRSRMDTLVLAQYVGSEDSVQAYFDYAHVLTVWERARALGAEMAALIELITGAPPTPETARSVTFPD